MEDDTPVKKKGCSPEDIQKLKTFVPVTQLDLDMLASMACENSHNGNPRYKKGETCFDHLYQGGCCNSCWARSMAQRYLDSQKEQWISED